jgi:hypothetical protein
MVDELTTLLREAPDVKVRQKIIREHLDKDKRRLEALNPIMFIDSTECEHLWLGDRITIPSEGGDKPGYVVNFFRWHMNPRYAPELDFPPRLPGGFLQCGLMVRKEHGDQVFAGVMPDNFSGYRCLPVEQCQRVIPELTQITMHEYLGFRLQGRIEYESAPLFVQSGKGKHAIRLDDAVRARHVELHSDTNAYVLGDSEMVGKIRCASFVLYKVLKASGIS